jgi:hypothetical protein
MFQAPFDGAMAASDSGFLSAVAEGLLTDGTIGQQSLHY